MKVGEGLVVGKTKKVNKNIKERRDVNRSSI